MSIINCTEFNRLVNEAVESHRRIDAPTLREHATHCDRCRPAWLDALLLEQAVEQWKLSIPSVELAHAVVSHLAAEAVHEAVFVSNRQPQLVVSTDFIPPFTGKRPLLGRIVRPSLVTAISGLAAAVLFGFFVSAHFSGPKIEMPTDDVRSASFLVPEADQPARLANERGPTRIENNIRTVAAARSSITVDPQIQALARDAGSAYLNLASDAADAIAAAALLVPPAESPAIASPAAQSVDEYWVDEVGRELKPVTERFSQAFEFLIDAVPSEKAPPT
jgi:hypothetical protein